MKILLIVNTDGALYGFRKPIIQKLISLGHEVISISSESTYFERLRNLGVKPIGLNFSRHSVSPLQNFLLITQLYRLIKRERPDIVHSFTHKPAIYGSISARFLGIKKIHVTITGLGTLFIKKNIMSLVLRKLLILQYRIALRMVESVFFQNPDDMDFFVKQKIVRLDQAILTNGSGINLSEFPIANTTDCLKFRHNLSRELNVDLNQRQVILFPARGVIEKGFFEFYNAAKLLSESNPFQYVFLHAGLIDSAVTNHISGDDIGLFAKVSNVHYLGFREDIHELMLAADIVCLPSYREGVPRSLIEGLALGKPLVTTDVPGCREVVVDGWNGFLCVPQNYESLSMQLKKVTPDFCISAKSRSREL